MKFSDTFKNFKDDVLKASGMLVKNLWNGSEEAQETAIKDFIKAVSDSYSVPTPNIVYQPGNSFGYFFTGGGKFDGETNTIHLYKNSFVTLAHVTRLWLASEGAVEIRLGKPLLDAIGWSLSLFKRVAPDSFEKAYLSGKLVYEKPTEEEIFVSGFEATLFGSNNPRRSEDRTDGSNRAE